MAKFTFSDGREFDSEQGEMTFGDMEALEQQGINWSSFDKGGVSLTAIRTMATLCFKKTGSAEVSDEEIKALPIKRLKELGEFVNAFFTRNFPTENANS